MKKILLSAAVALLLCIALLLASCKKDSSTSYDFVSDTSSEVSDTKDTAKQENSEMSDTDETDKKESETEEKWSQDRK